jgi:hypothetical protein
MMGTGAVLQVVFQLFTTNFTTTSTTPQASGISLSITPQFTTSKILIMAYPLLYVNQNGQGTGFLYGQANLYKNSATQLHFKQMSMNTTGITPTDLSETVPLMYLDSPSTTGAVSYQIYVNSVSSAFSTNLGWNSNYTPVTLMEIAG